MASFQFTKEHAIKLLRQFFVLSCLFILTICPLVAMAQSSGGLEIPNVLPPSSVTQTLPLGPNGYPSIDAYVRSLGYENNITTRTVVNADGSTSEVIDTVNGKAVDPDNSGNMGLVVAFIWNLLSQILFIFFVAIPVAIASLAGQIFNEAVNLFVIGMGELINKKTGIGFAINNLWVVVRDTMNIAFIFGLIYIGIRTILYSEDSGTRRTLGYLIAAALFINFSLFIAKAVIDFSNMLATQIAVLMNVDTAQGSVGYLSYTGISGGFFHTIGLQTILSSVDLGSVTRDSTKWSEAVKLATLMFMTLIFFVILTVIFLAGAFMLLARFIALIIYMVFSPVMFLGWILPNFAQFSKDWFESFVRKAFFAPLFMFMLYMSLVTAQQLRAGLPGAQTSNFANAVNGLDGFNIIMVYIFATGMLIASIIVAQKMSVAGASTTMGILKGMQNGATSRLNNVRLGAQSLVARNTLGLAGNALANATQSLESTRFGRNVNRVTTLATGGIVDTQARINAGKTLAGNKFGGSRSYESNEKYNKERTIKIAQGEEKNNLISAIKAFQKNGSDENRSAMERALRDAPNSVITDMARDSKNRELIKSVAGELTDSQWKAISEDKEIDIATQNELGKSRSSQVQDRLKRMHGGAGSKASGNVPLTEVIPRADASELKSIGLTAVLPYAEFLNSKQLDDWKDLTPTEKTQLKDARKEQLRKTWNGPMGSQVIFQRFKTDNDRANLPDFILNSDEAVPILTTGVLSKIAENPGLDSIRPALKKRILDYYTANLTPGMTGPNTPDKEKLDKFKEWFDKNNIGQRF